MRAGGILGFLLCLASPLASAGELPRLAKAPARPPLISEMRLGLQAHDPWSPEHGTLDLAATVLFAKLHKAEGALDIVIPRLHLGAALNTAGKTGHIHAGATWTLDLGPAVFVEASLGGALHDGRTGGIVPIDRSAMGCALHFREAAAIGYRLDRNWSVIGTLEHLSNGGLCTKNRGLTNLGVMVGYRF